MHIFEYLDSYYSSFGHVIQGLGCVKPCELIQHLMNVNHSWNENECFGQFGITELPLSYFISVNYPLRQVI